MVSPISLKIRAKKLGVLIKDARTATGKSALECAQAIGVPEEVYQHYEAGDQSPSLPEVEMLAYFLQIPMDHFWGTEVLSGEHSLRERVDPKVLLGLRQRVVGVMLRKARLDAGMEVDGLAARTGIQVELIRAYEFGEKPVPVPELNSLAAAMGFPTHFFQDKRGPIGAWMLEQHSLGEFRKLPPELQAFVSKPINRPYLELAQRLSEMSVEKLRAVAEGLLEITL